MVSILLLIGSKLYLPGGSHQGGARAQASLQEGPNNFRRVQHQARLEPLFAGSAFLVVEPHKLFSQLTEVRRCRFTHRKRMRTSFCIHSDRWPILGQQCTDVFSIFSLT